MAILTLNNKLNMHSVFFLDGKVKFKSYIWGKLGYWTISKNKKYNKLNILLESKIEQVSLNKKLCDQIHGKYT